MRDQGPVVEFGAGLGLDDGGDGFTELVVGHADDDRVVDVVVRLERLLDFFGKTFSPPVLMQTDPRPSRLIVPSLSTVAQSPGIEYRLPPMVTNVVADFSGSL